MSFTIELQFWLVLASFISLSWQHYATTIPRCLFPKIFSPALHFTQNLSALSSNVMQSRKTGTNCPKMSVTNYQSTYRNIPDEERSELRNYYCMDLEPYSVLGRRM